MNFLPGGGINVILPAFLWVCNFDYNCICATEGDVWAVKVNIKFAFALFLSIWAINDVFPVPVGAVKYTGSKFYTKASTIEE